MKVHPSSNNRDCICLRSSQEFVLISEPALLTALYRISKSLVEFSALSPDAHSHRQLPGLLHCLGVSGSCWHKTDNRILASGQCTTVKRLKPLYKQKGPSPIQEHLKKHIIMQISKYCFYKKQTNSREKPAVKYNCDLD